MRVILSIILIAVTLAAGSAAASDFNEELRERLLATTGPTASEQLRLRAGASVRRFYEARDFVPIWVGSSDSALRDDLLAAINSAEDHGLDSDDYHLAALESRIEDNDQLAAELLATDAYLTLAAHILGGRVDPKSVEPDWSVSQQERDLVAHLERAYAQRNVRESLEELAPDTQGYRILKEALGMYREALSEGGWEHIPQGRLMELGDRGPQVALLRARLRATGFLEVGDVEAQDLFDNAVEDAVAAIQRRVGIEPDGIVGPVTLRQLNMGPADRIAQIRANLERWRWLPDDLGERHIRVNIADYRLESRNKGHIVRVHDVVVGRTYRKTPVFSDAIEYLVFNPWWETPPSLARQDKLPDFQRDPGLVMRLGFQVLDRDGQLVDPSQVNWTSYSSKNFPFRLRQRPGPLNALGQVKIMFPNPHNVYLHDTPSRELFARAERAFSSGCVRVYDAIGLSEWILSDIPEWSRDRIDETLTSSAERRVSLSRPVPVHILYFTAVSEPDGSLRLINDIYDRDARLIAALDERPSSK